MTIYESERVKVLFDESIPCVTWIPVGFLKDEEFREPIRVGMDFFVKNFNKYPNLTWLNDAVALTTVSMGDVKWLNANVNDRAYQAGASKVAFVLPHNIFGKVAIKIYVDFTQSRADNKLDIKAFKTIEEAKIWLKQGKGDGVRIV